MARFTRIDKVDNTYRPVSFDLTRQNELMYNQLKDEQKDLNDISTNDANAKLKYAELLTKIRPEDYHKAEKMLDEYTYNRAKQIAGSKDKLSLSESLNSYSNFLSDTNFGLMMKDYEKEQAVYKSDEEMKQRGFNSTILNESVLNKSMYDDLGNRVETTIIGADGKPKKATLDDVRTERVFEYATAKSDLLDKLVQNNVFSNTYQDPKTGAIITESVSLKDKPRLKRAAEASASNYIQSTEGKAELSQLMSTDGVRPPLTRDEAVAEITRSYVAIALQKAEEKHTEIARNPPKGSSGSGSENNNLALAPSFIPTRENILLKDNAFFSSDVAIATLGSSSYKPSPEEQIIQVTKNDSYFGNASPSGEENAFSDAGGFVNKPANVKAVSAGYHLNPIIQKVVKIEKDGSKTKEVPVEKAKIGQNVSFGSNGTTGIKDLKPELQTDDDGNNFYQSGNLKVYVQKVAQEQFNYINDDGKSGVVFKDIKDPVMSKVYFGGDYVRNRPIQVEADGKLKVNTEPKELYKAIVDFANITKQQIDIYKKDPQMYKALLDREDRLKNLMNFANQKHNNYLLNDNDRINADLLEKVYSYHTDEKAKTLINEITFGKTTSDNALSNPYLGSNKTGNSLPKSTK